MTETLTAEEIAELRYFHASKSEYVPTLALKTATLHSLLAMASRLVEVESALEFLDNNGAFAKLAKPGAFIFALRPAAVLVVATDLGWTPPTQKPNDGGRDES